VEIRYDSKSRSPSADRGTPNIKNNFSRNDSAIMLGSNNNSSKPNNAIVLKNGGGGGGGGGGSRFQTPRSSLVRHQINRSSPNHQPSFSKEISTRNNSACVSNNSTRITKILLIVSFSFIILNSPYRVACIITHIHMLIEKKEHQTMFEFIVKETLLNIYYASYSVNFFLYSLCGKKFRESFKGLCFALVFFFYFRLTKLLNFVLKRK
jgi:hypothetical protein